MNSKNKDLEFDRFKTTLDEAIQRYAPIKKRYVRANEAPFMKKKINKEIMKRSPEADLGLLQHPRWSAL